MNRLFGPMGFLVIFLMFGCQGTNEVVNLKVYGLAPSPEKAFLEQGGLEAMTNQITGGEDHEVMQRKTAISDSCLLR